MKGDESSGGESQMLKMGTIGREVLLEKKGVVPGQTSIVGRDKIFSAVL